MLAEGCIRDENSCVASDRAWAPSRGSSSPTTLPGRYAGPQESWRIGGETLPELELESEAFASYGDLVLSFPSWSMRLECEMESNGEISAEEDIEESFAVYGCALYKIEGGEKAKNSPAEPLTPTSPTTTGPGPRAKCSSPSTFKKK